MLILSQYFSMNLQNRKLSYLKKMTRAFHNKKKTDDDIISKVNINIIHTFQASSGG